MSGFYYLASPYSQYREGIGPAWMLACRQSGLLIKAGVPIFSPIAHSHPIAIHGEIDAHDHEVWLGLGLNLMEAAIGVIVLCADGWEESKGMAYELDYFRAAGKPIIMMQPDQVPEELLESPRPGPRGPTGEASPSSSRASLPSLRPSLGSPIPCSSTSTSGSSGAAAAEILREAAGIVAGDRNAAHIAAAAGWAHLAWSRAAECCRRTKR